MSKGIAKTNAARLLDTLGIAYELHQAEVDLDDLSAAAMARKLGAPEEQVFKTLVARGDRSGVLMACIPAAAELDLKALAARSYTDAEFEEKRMQYDHARPFTKESLLYREIFEKYYPGQSHMVVDFWMPNKTWPGCDVDDPSARVLKNYGDSGK